jgi:hypothetical protein
MPPWSSWSVSIPLAAGSFIATVSPSRTFAAPGSVPVRTLDSKGRCFMIFGARRSGVWSGLASLSAWRSRAVATKPVPSSIVTTSLVTVICERPRNARHSIQPARHDRETLGAVWRWGNGYKNGDRRRFKQCQKGQKMVDKLLKKMVPEVGLEPTRRVDPRGILSPVRLPIPPLRHQIVVLLPVFCREHQRAARAISYVDLHPRSRRGTPRIHSSSHTPAKNASLVLSTPANHAAVA